MSQYWEEKADQALHEHEKLDPAQLRRQVILVMKEVERDTRHNAADLARRLSGDIHNMSLGEGRSND